MQRNEGRCESAVQTYSGKANEIITARFSRNFCSHQNQPCSFCENIPVMFSVSITVILAVAADSESSFLA